MKRYPTKQLFTWLAAAAVLCLSTAVGYAQSLQVQLETMLQGMDLGGADLAIHVADVATGQTVAEHDADRSMIPASNMKLVTTAAAIGILGPDFHFRTELIQRGDDLIVVGDGDPAFGDPELLDAMGMDVEDLLARWSAAAQRAGIERVDRLIVDDRIFDRKFVHPGWPDDQLEKWYAAQVAGLNFNDNVLDIYAVPTKAGQAPLIATMPTDPAVVLTNAAVTGSKNAVWPTREMGTNRITVRGQVKHRLLSPVHITIDDPPIFFGETLAKRLEADGIDVAKVVRADDTMDLQGGRLIAVVRTPLAEVLNRTNKDSQNLFAEALIKRMGHKATSDPGSWSSGSAAVRMFLARTLGSDAAGVVIDDGSGLSRENRISAQLMTDLLTAMHHAEPERAAMFRQSLSVGGEDGTLRKRFAGTTVEGTIRGKSGYIRHTLALSGYITHDDHEYAFSIFLNDYPRAPYLGKRLIDQFVRTIDQSMAELPETSVVETESEPNLGG